MAQSDYHWSPGQSGNPNGRPSGARNKTSYALRERLKARGDKDPAEFLSELVSNESEPKELRIAASGQLMPYYHSKLGAIPVQPDLVYFEQAVTLPRPTSIREAYENILKLTEMKALGQLDVVSADSLINDQRTVLNAMVDEAKLDAAQGGSPEQVIRIEGGLPELPGTTILMPQLNGHVIPAVDAITGPEPKDPVDFNADPRPEAPPYNDGQPPNEEP
jgi:hypothetical protein